MKQKLTALLMSLMLLFSLVGCADDYSVAIIGGADGPTSIVVTDGENSKTGTKTDDGIVWDEEAPSGEQDLYGDVPAIDEYGTYNSAEDVSLYLYTYGHLPYNYITKSEARDLGWSGGGVEEYAGEGYAIGGDKFGNREGLLPRADGRQYYECDIDTVGTDDRGAKRIVWSNDGLIFYTPDHYKSFTLLYGEE